MESDCPKRSLILFKADELIGNAKEKINQFVEQVNVYSKKHPNAKEYMPGTIL